MATITGTSGNDREDYSLSGTVNSDRYRGLGGDDWFYVSTGNDTIEGGSGFDVVIYEWGALDWVKINLTNTQRYGLAAQTVQKSNGQIDSLSSIEGIHGTAGNDLILLSGGGYTFDGEGDDVIYIYDNSSVFLGGGNDRIIGSGSAWINFDNVADPYALNGMTIMFNQQGAGKIFDDVAGTVDSFRGIFGVNGTLLSDRVFGGSGNDVAEGLGGDDFLSGAGGNDTLSGGDGDDTLDGGSGNNVLRGGEGDDTYTCGYEGTTWISDSIGSNRLQVEKPRWFDPEDSYFKELIRDGDALVLRGSNGSEMVIEDSSALAGITWFSSIEETSEYYMAMDDLYIGTAGNDVLQSHSEGYAEMFGGGGNDVMSVESGTALLTGDGGNDTLYGGEGDDGLQGDQNADNPGNDVLSGGGGNDRLWGGDGNDSLSGGSGDDSIYGGSGNDTIDDGIGTDYIDGGDGVDTFQRNLSLEYEDYSFTTVVDLEVGKLGDEDNFDILVNIENVNLTGNFNDNILGDSANNTFKSNNGNDLLDGRGGNDSLDGGSGNDTLNGGNGKDSLVGSFGNDTFVFNSVAESGITAVLADVITDFVAGQDKVDLFAIDAFAGTVANNTFIWRGTAAFNNSTNGEVRYQKFDVAGTANDHTMIWIDNDRDTGVEMAIRLTGLHTLTASDFVL